MTTSFRYGPFLAGDTPGSVNASPASKPTRHPGFRVAAPRSIPLRRWHRLAPYPTLCAPLRSLL